MKKPGVDGNMRQTSCWRRHGFSNQIYYSPVTEPTKSQFDNIYYLSTEDVDDEVISTETNTCVGVNNSDFFQQWF